MNSKKNNSGSIAIKDINKCYRDFSKKIKEIEAERDRKILAVLKRIEKEKIAKINKEIINSY